MTCLRPVRSSSQLGCNVRKPWALRSRKQTLRKSGFFLLDSLTRLASSDDRIWAVMLVDSGLAAWAKKGWMLAWLQLRCDT